MGIKHKNLDGLNMPKMTAKRLTVKDFFGGFDAVSDESVLPAQISCDTYNFDFSSGALKDGCGFADLSASVALSRIWKYNRFSSGEEIIMAAAGSGEVYFLRDGKLEQLYGITMRGDVYATNYRLHGSDVILISSSESPLAVWDGVNSPIVVTDSPNIKSMDMYCGLMFVVDSDGETLRYTDDIDPTNWNGPMTEGGRISLVDERGRVNKIISFLNYLYVFRDYGISRISLSQGQPVYSGLYVSSGRIYADSICLCGDKILFLSGDGLYEFDGLSTKRLLKNLSGFIQPQKGCCAEFSDGKYRFACMAKAEGVVGCEGGQYTNNVFIVYSPDDGKYSISRGVDVRSIAEANGQVYAIAGSYLTRVTDTAQLRGQPLKKRWRSPLSDLGSQKAKAFSDVYIDTAGEIELSLITENGVRTYTVKGGEGPQRVRVDARGRRISMLIESVSTGARISRPSIVYTEL